MDVIFSYAFIAFSRINGGAALQNRQGERFNSAANC